MTRISAAWAAGALVEVGPVHPVPGLLEAQAVDRVDVEDGDGIGVGDGHLLDLDPALGRQHAQVLLGAAVEGEAGVVLAVDVRGVLDPQPLDHVALDVEAEDVAGVGAELGLVVGQLDAAGLAAAAHLDLGLDHHRVAGSAAATTASSTVSATPPLEMGMPNRAKYCLPWYSKRSTGSVPLCLSLSVSVRCLCDLVCVSCLSCLVCR